MEEIIKKFCEKWGINEFSIFGSNMRNELKDDSDVDVLISFRENLKYSLFELKKKGTTEYIEEKRETLGMEDRE
ncbi:MAG: hypothetical protein EHM58_13840 [Ignavibacteriae bacterium]|nr:MAG: hypothetical protein EHM58_13840 [Ignavibacteriota bacterium]